MRAAARLAAFLVALGVTGAVLLPERRVEVVADDGQAETVLTISTTKKVAKLALTVVGFDGTFAESGADDRAEFAVATNNATGYTLSIGASDNSGELANEDKNCLKNCVLESIVVGEDGLSAEEFDASSYNGKWGIKPSKYGAVENDKFRAAPNATAVVLDKTEQANSSANEYTLAVGARADQSQGRGKYIGSYVLTVVANPVEEESPARVYMQDVTVEKMAELLPNSGDMATLYDRRDGADYKVRNIDGGYWMVQNLRIMKSNGKANGVIAAEDSNFTGDDVNIFAAGDLSGGSTTYYAAQAHVADEDNVAGAGELYTKEELGAWYNYCAASANTACGGVGETSAVADICPAGWELPTPSQYSELVNQQTDESRTYFGAIYGGYYYDDGQIYVELTRGYWWTKEGPSNASHYILEYSNGNFWTEIAGSGRSGMYVRCVLKTS